ncbi:nephrin-like [Saccostrea cucullata]|uniref:nephrin-like n=1 Tax=Saccostrea cuccullata TaxID=36930 RepID=UPI002ED04132
MGIYVFLMTCLLAIHVFAEDDVILAVLGNAVVLDCKIPQTDTIIWDRPDGTIIAIKGVLHRSVNASRYSVQNTTLLQSLSIHNLMLQDDGVYRCYDLTDAGIKQNFTVNIFVRPTQFSVKGPVGTVNEGSVQTLTCRADAGIPPPFVRWHLLGPNTNGTTYTGFNSDTKHPNGTILRVNTLRLQISREMYKGSIICDTSIQYYYQVQQTVVLDVNLAPLTPIFDGFTGLFDDGDSKPITCHSNGSRPAANIYWMLNGVRLNSTSSQRLKNADDTYLVRGTLIWKLTKAMENQVLSCVVTNSVLQTTTTRSRSRSVVLLPNYSPSISADNGTRTVIEGKSLVLHCVIEARPLPPESQKLWFFNGHPISDSNYNNITRFDVSLSMLRISIYIKNIHRNQSGQYSCQGYNHLGAAKSPVMNVQTLYSPICSFSGVQKYAVPIGGRVTLTCRVTANPNNVTMRWRYIQRNAPIKTGLLGDVESHTVSSTTIAIDVTSTSQYADIACIAANMVGDMLFPCLYRIMEPSPPEIPQNCSLHALSDTEIQIECTPGFNGGSPQHFLLQMLEGYNDRNFNTISNHSTPSFIVPGLTPNTNYTFRMCSGSSAFARTISCGGSLRATTLAAHGVDKKRISSATSEASTTPYIVGGVVGFLVLVVLISVLAYCLHKNRKRGGNPLRSNQIPWRTSDWFKNTESSSTSVGVKPGIQNSAFVEDTVHLEKNSNEKEHRIQEESIYRLDNAKLRNLEEKDSIKLSKANATTLLALSREYNANESGDKVDKIDFGFLGDQVTDLDELSNPRSPGLMLTSGSPHRDFSYSKTDLDLKSPQSKPQCPETLDNNFDTETKQKSLCTHSLNDLRSGSVAHKQDYIKLSYTEPDSGDPQNQVSASEGEIDDLKRTFISRYTLEFLRKDDNGPSKTQNSPASSTSNISGVDSYGGAPRRQSYTLAISSDEEGNTMVRDVLSASVNISSSIYDIPRNSGGFEVEVESAVAVPAEKDLVEEESPNSDSRPDREVIAMLSPNEGLEGEKSDILKHKTSPTPTSDIPEDNEFGKRKIINLELSENLVEKKSHQTNPDNSSSCGAYF